MASTYLNLGQVAPSAATLTTLYTVPASTSAVVSSLIISNTGTTTDFFRVSVQVGGAADNIKQYIYGGNVSSGVAINGNDTLVANLGLTLATTDVVKVYSVNGNCSFSLFGVQLT